MDGHRFDAIVRHLLGDGNRRRLMRGGIGALAATIFTSGNGAIDRAEAKKKKKVAICLNGQALSVPKKKAKKFYEQGATQGACPPPPPPNPPAPPSPPPPLCLAAKASCDTGTCCAGLVCDDNFCSDDPTVCCGKPGAACSDDCGCCEFCSFCNDDGTCDCDGAVCGGICTCGNCCTSEDCPETQFCDDGICTCPTGFTCGDACCDAGDQVCNVDPGPVACEDGSCPTYDFCNADTYFTCGDFCDCVTSITNESHCTDWVEGACFDCTTNQQCVDILGTGAFCVPGGATFCGELCDDPDQNFCVVAGCSPLRRAQRNAGDFNQKPMKGLAGVSDKPSLRSASKSDRRRKKRPGRGRR